MAALSTVLYAFNRGLISRLALAREDIKRLAMAADVYFTNWMPRVMGSMMLRPGLKFIGSTAGNLACKFLPFVFSTSDTALIEISTSLVRVWISDALVTRVSVATAVTNGTMPSDLTGWTQADDSGATSGLSE